MVSLLLDVKGILEPMLDNHDKSGGERGLVDGTIGDTCARGRGGESVEYGASSDACRGGGGGSVDGVVVKYLNISEDKSQNKLAISTRINQTIHQTLNTRNRETIEVG
jgi:hypothetical protein